MAFLDWIKDRGAGKGMAPTKPAEEVRAPLERFSPNRFGFSSFEMTEKGNRISGLSKTEWRSNDGGITEFRQHIGLSKEGYHGGLEVFHRCEGGSFNWSKACAEERGAEKASYGLREEFENRESHNLKTTRRPAPSWER
jgi:hypothetical protein